MNDQEGGRVRPLNSEDDRARDENPQTGSTGGISFGASSVMPQNTSTSQEDGPCFDTLQGFSSIELFSPMFPANELYPRTESEIPCSQDVNMHGSDRGQSSTVADKDASESSQIQICLEDGAKEDGECKKNKRKRSAEVHNLNERIRRQKLKEKMKAVQELVPNCNKKDKSSTLDDVIKYIKTLQYQVQVMSMGAGHSMLYSMPPMPQMPVIPPGLATCARPVIGMGHGIGMGMSCMSSLFNFPISQLGLPNPPSTSGLPPLSGAQYPYHVLGSLPLPTFPISIDPPQGVPFIQNEPCEIPRTTSDEQSIERGSMSWVLPSTVIPLDPSVQGFGSSGSGTTQWPSSAVTRSDDSVTEPRT